MSKLACVKYVNQLIIRPNLSFWEKKQLQYIYMHCQQFCFCFFFLYTNITSLVFTNFTFKYYMQCDLIVGVLISISRDERF